MSLPGTDPQEPASKVVTYQCLCKVKGKMRFGLVSSTSGVSFDEVIITSPTMLDDMDELHYEYTDVVLVTLRVQLYDHIPATDVPTFAVVVLENLSDIDVDSDISALQVYWQQAWGGSDAQPDEYPLALGLANSGQARVTAREPVTNTYNWAVNALGIKAASRFQLPLLDTATGGDAAGMGWQSQVAATDYELVDGEMYQDFALKSLMGRSDDRWFTFVQPDRFAYQPGGFTWQGGNEKNLIYDDGANYTVTLETDLAKVSRGSAVRIFNFNTGGTLRTITVQVGTTPLTTVVNTQMAEFLFWVDDRDMDPNNWVGHWIIVQRGVTTGILPAI